VSNRKKIKPKRYRDRLNAYGAMPPEDLALLGVEFAVDFALAVLHEAVQDEDYQFTAEQAGKLLALAQTVEL
jgi:hypothetical protein